MNRILMFFVTMLPLLFWNKLSAVLFGAPDAPAATGAAPAAQASSGMKRKIVDYFAQRMAGAHVDDRMLELLTLAAAVYSLVLGYLFHAALGERAFGPRLNGLFSFFGAASGVGGLLFLAGKPQPSSLTALIYAAMFGSAALLIALSILKALVAAKIDELASGGGAARPPAALGRLNAVANRRRA